MYPKQRGITMIGWLVLLLPLAIIVYTCIRLVPIYLNYNNVSKALTQTAQNLQGEDSLSVVTIQNALGKNMVDVQAVEFPKIDDIAITRQGDGWLMEANYEETVHLFLNLSVLVKFDKQVEIHK